MNFRVINNLIYLILREQQFRVRVLRVSDKCDPLTIQELLMALKMYPHMFSEFDLIFSESAEFLHPSPSLRDHAQAAAIVHKSGGSNSLSVTGSLGRERDSWRQYVRCGDEQ